MKILRGLLAASTAAMFLLTLSCERGEREREEAREHADTRAADEAAIRAASAEWSKVAAAKDVEKSISYYADDASYSPPGAPIAIGKEAIRKAWAQFLGDPALVSLEWTTTKVEAARSGDLAYETGAYRAKYKDKKGKETSVTGKYVTAWEKQADGKWKAVADIDNTDK